MGWPARKFSNWLPQSHRWEVQNYPRWVLWATTSEIADHVRSCGRVLVARTAWIAHSAICAIVGRRGAGRRRRSKLLRRKIREDSSYTSVHRVRPLTACILSLLDGYSQPFCSRADMHAIMHLCTDDGSHQRASLFKWRMTTSLC